MDFELSYKVKLKVYYEDHSRVVSKDISLKSDSQMDYLHNHIIDILESKNQLSWNDLDNLLTEDVISGIKEISYLWRSNVRTLKVDSETSYINIINFILNVAELGEGVIIGSRRTM